MEKNIEVSEESGVEEITREQAYYIMGRKFPTLRFSGISIWT